MMKIPIGASYTFTIRVTEEDSINTKDLSDLVTVSFAIYSLDGASKVIEIPGSDGLWHVIDAANGKLQIKIEDTATAKLTEDIGTKADRYYIKPGYRGSLHLTFGDGTEILTAIKEIAAIKV